MSQDASQLESAAPIVVGLGELLWDCVPAGPRWGGAPANFAYHVGQLGAEPWVVSAIGDDASGTELAAAAEAHGVRLCLSRVAGHPTGRVDVELDAAGQPTFHIADDSAWDHMPWTTAMADLAARTDAACFGTLAQRTATARGSIYRFLDAMPTAALRVFDANLRAPYFTKDIALGSLERATVLKVNADEWAIVADWFDLAGDFGEAGRRLCDRFDLSWIIQTLGGDGSRIVGSGVEVAAPAASTVPTDTVGAGDSFSATVCWGLLRGADPVELLSVASRVAAYVCTQPGGTPVLPEPLVAETRGLAA